MLLVFEIQVKDPKQLVETLKENGAIAIFDESKNCLLYTSPSPRERTRYRMPSSA